MTTAADHFISTIAQGIALTPRTSHVADGVGTFARRRARIDAGVPEAIAAAAARQEAEYDRSEDLIRGAVAAIGVETARILDSLDHGWHADDSLGSAHRSLQEGLTRRYVALQLLNPLENAVWESVQVEA